jgi:hypothetical protein
VLVKLGTGTGKPRSLAVSVGECCRVQGAWQGVSSGKTGGVQVWLGQVETDGRPTDSDACEPEVAGQASNATAISTFSRGFELLNASLRTRPPRGSQSLRMKGAAPRMFCRHCDGDGWSRDHFRVGRQRVAGAPQSRIHRASDWAADHGLINSSKSADRRHPRGPSGLPATPV